MHATHTRTQQLATLLAKLPSRGSLATLLAPAETQLRTISKAMQLATSKRPNVIGGLRIARGYSIFSESKVHLFRNRVDQQVSSLQSPTEKADVRVCNTGTSKNMSVDRSVDVCVCISRMNL